MHVLVADDNAINRQFLRAIFEARGDRVSEAKNGQQAIEACRATPFDVVLMDIRMPEIDGVEATRIIQGEMDDAPCIVGLTADLSAQEQEHLLDRGFAACLTKPIAKEELLGAVMRSLRGGQPRRGTRSGESIDSTAPIDRETALAAAGGNPDLVRKLTAMLLHELNDFAPKIDQLLGSGQWPQARELVHKLRASSGFCGALPLQQTATDLEAGLKASDQQDIDESLTPFRQELDRLRTFLQNNPDCR